MGLDAARIDTRTAQRERRLTGAPAQPSGFHASGFVVLRTPVLPFTDLLDWGHGLEAARRDGGGVDVAGLDDVLARDRLVLRRRLEGVVAGHEFRDALFVASPSLETAIDLWRKDPDSDRGRAAEQALVSYFTRACARPAPFGLFAGISVGEIGTETDLRLGGRERYRRHTRLDMDYLWTLAAAIERDPAVRRDLVFRPNSSLYEAGSRLCYAEARQGSGGRSYHLVAVDKTPYLLDTLERAGSGARLDALAAGLVDDEVTLADADEYLAELVDSQVLIADVRPQLTGPPPTDALVATLAERRSTADIARRLAEAAEGLRSIDRHGMGVALERYREVIAVLDGLPAAPQPSRFVQVDLTKPAPGLVLGADVVAEMLRGAQLLHAFTSHREDEGLRRFREQFTERYEDREVPVAEALDEENGIGFERIDPAGPQAAPLLAGLPLHPHAERPGRWTDRDALLLERLAEALAAGQREISLDPSDVEAARRPDTPPLPDAFEVLGEVVASSRDALTRGDFRVFVRSASGPSGVRVVGRFCSADDRLEQLAREHLRAEERVQPDRVFAEVVHLPEGRVGNILSRPVLREYEIPYLGRSGAPPERQLPLTDLLVSVRGQRIVLRSRRLGREVNPRLTTAHQFTSGLGVYRFLCALQHQQIAPGVFWDWGPLGAAPFLPAVVSGRVTLSRPRWNLGASDLAAFRQPRGARQFAAVQRLRERRGIPRLVALLEGENELPVDLENVLSVEALAHHVRERPSASFVEVTAPHELAVSGPEGRFAHQVLVPFVRSPRAAPAPVSALRTSPPGRSIPRRFPPGSEWLYAKLFTGPATTDRVLDLVGPVVDVARRSGAADGWFFIRYGDPDWHLRVRVHGRPQALLGEVLPLLHRAARPLLESGELWRLQLDTYEREIERYGGPHAIELAEQVFTADSDAVLAVVRSLPGDAGADLRWLLGILGIDLLFDDLGLSLEERRTVARWAREGYGAELGADGDFRGEVGRRYRQRRADIEALLDPAQQPPPVLAPGVQALRRRSEAVAQVAPELRSLADAGRLTVGMPELAMSLAHMHVNRLLRSAQRAQELVLYEMLDRAYSSRAARRSR